MIFRFFWLCLLAFKWKWKWYWVSEMIAMTSGNSTHAWNGVARLQSKWARGIFWCISQSICSLVDCKLTFDVTFYPSFEYTKKTRCFSRVLWMKQNPDWIVCTSLMLLVDIGLIFFRHKCRINVFSIVYDRSSWPRSV